MKSSYKVWHVPQIPMKAFEVPVESAQQGFWLLDVLRDYDLFQYEQKIKLDYANESGLMRWSDEEQEWLDVEEDEES